MPAEFTRVLTNSSPGIKAPSKSQIVAAMPGPSTSETKATVTTATEWKSSSATEGATKYTGVEAPGVATSVTSQRNTHCGKTRGLDCEPPATSNRRFVVVAATMRQ